MPPSDRVPNAPLRDAVLRSGQPYSTLAASLGWTCKRVNGEGRVSRGGDTARLKRSLGLQPDRGRHYQSMDRTNALKITEALGLDPIDVGL